MDRTKNATRNIIWGMFNKLIMLVFPFVIRSILIWTLGSEYLGLSSLFNSILQILNLSELGFSTAVVFSLYKPLAEDDIIKIHSIMNYYKMIYRIIGSVILVSGILLMPFLNLFIKNDIPQDINIYTLYLIFLLNTVFSYWLFAYKSSLLIANQRNDININISTVSFVAQYIIQIVVLIVIKNYYFYIVWTLIFTIIRNILISRVVDRYYGKYLGEGILQKQERKAINVKVRGLMVQKLCDASRNSFDNIVVSASLGLIAVAQYGNYYYILYAVHGIMDVIIVSSLSGIGQSIVIETEEKNYRDFKKFSFMYFWLICVATTCLMCLYQDFMQLWVGKNLLLSNKIMLLFCLYFFVLCSIDVRTLYENGVGIWEKTKTCVIVESVLNVFLNFVLGMKWGIIGIVSASIISLVLVNVIFKSRYIFKLYFQNYKVTDYYCSVIKWLIFGCISSFVTYYLCSYIHFTVMINLILKVVLCLIISNVILILLNIKNPMRKEMKEFIINIIRKMLRR